MNQPLDRHALEQVFFNARTFNKFTSQEVPDALILQLYELMKWGPTSMNCQPGHYVFIKSPAAKQKLKEALMPGNQDKTMAAPATVIVAMDMQFYQHLPQQFPANPNAKAMFEANQELTRVTAKRNGTLQGAYLILAARMLGLDCGPMSGFNNQMVDQTFFPDGRYKSNFLINIGYGDASGNYPRGPRVPFAEAVEIL
ncbi:malonic semialdehyde reductase [uncultured Tolumonas sp.]|uniref:malonic semialdehyde reductase n=1 Tax=uncultured Tolumonas sp. TaxID=263765 RepID=UPI002A0A428B|nr:malonic semialdehyde reductase [uncultured Tolumonas sp.]